MKHIEIHETAFVTSTLRSLDEHLSKDKYAKLWHNPKAEKWVEAYLTNVCSEETQAHCMRNRYFLDKMSGLVADKKIEVLINFGCGFSMYPFLLEKELIHIEIDKPEIIEYKESKINNWQKTKVLPNRKINFLKVDFSETYQDDLWVKISAIKGNKSCFVLLEGVLFFLSKLETDNLFDFFRTIQKKGDYIGCASFKDSLKSKLSYKKLISFINEKVVKTNENDYQTISNKFYKNREDYHLIDHQDYFSLSKKYSNPTQLNKEEILNENFYLLQMINKKSL